MILDSKAGPCLMTRSIMRWMRTRRDWSVGMDTLTSSLPLTLALGRALKGKFRSEDAAFEEDALTDEDDEKEDETPGKTKSG